MKKIILSTLLVLLVPGFWWSYKLIWGKPLSFHHAMDRTQLEYALKDPEILSFIGIIDNTILDFHSDDLTDASPEFEKKLLKKARLDLNLLRCYDRKHLGEQEQYTYDIMAWYFENTVHGEKFDYHLASKFCPGPYPVNQLFGIQSETPNFMTTTHRVIDKRSAKNYISRLSKFDEKFGQVLEGLKQREGRGVLPPGFVIEKVLDQMRNFISTPTTENILFDYFYKKVSVLDTLTHGQKENYYNDVEETIKNSVYPAYEKLIAYFNALSGKATNDDGVWKLPDGDAYYAYLLRTHTTTDLSPDEVHEIGIREVSRIQKEMQGVLESLGEKGKGVAEHMVELSGQKRFLYPDSDEGRARILSDYRIIIENMENNLSKVFDLRPAQKVEVKRVPVFKEKTSAGAYYNPPSLDGKRPGVFYANLRDVNEIVKFGMRTLAYHEAVPGHHFQIAIAQKIKGVPIFRRVYPFTAYAEGWALYAERLAWEYGFQSDPHNNLGRLQAELFRSVRLVVDTGIHYKRWTREQAIAYMLENTGMPETDVVAEIERYIVMPGQACAYKIGMLKILDLRKTAVEKLGSTFDIKEFHNVILENGSMPLSILERVVMEYIDAKKPGKN